VCNGEKYPDHAYPELGPKHTKVRAVGADKWLRCGEVVCRACLVQTGLRSNMQCMLEVRHHCLATMLSSLWLAWLHIAACVRCCKCATCWPLPTVLRLNACFADGSCLPALLTRCTPLLPLLRALCVLC